MNAGSREAQTVVCQNDMLGDVDKNIRAEIVSPAKYEEKPLVSWLTHPS